MRWFIPVATVLFLPTCSPQGEKAYTVDALIVGVALLTKITGEDRNNPDELYYSPLGFNAEFAEGKIRLQRMHKSLGR